MTSSTTMPVQPVTTPGPHAFHSGNSVIHMPRANKIPPMALRIRVTKFFFDIMILPPDWMTDSFWLAHHTASVFSNWWRVVCEVLICGMLSPGIATNAAACINCRLAKGAVQAVPFCNTSLLLKHVKSTGNASEFILQLYQIYDTMHLSIQDNRPWRRNLSLLEVPRKWKSSVRNTS